MILSAASRSTSTVAPSLRVTSTSHVASPSASRSIDVTRPPGKRASAAAPARCAAAPVACASPSSATLVVVAPGVVAPGVVAVALLVERHDAVVAVERDVHGAPVRAGHFGLPLRGAVAVALHRRHARAGEALQGGACGAVGGGPGHLLAGVAVAPAERGGGADRARAEHDSDAGGGHRLPLHVHVVPDC
jgi:hypothetical protein